MATKWIGLGVAPKREKLYAYQCNSAGLLEGAVMRFDPSANGQMVQAPLGAADTKIAGVIADVLNATTGSVVGTDVNLQRDGIAMVLLNAGQTVAEGDPLVTAAADGSVRKINRLLDSPCDVVGYSEVIHTAGVTNEMIPVRMNIHRFDIGQQ